MLANKSILTSIIIIMLYSFSFGIEADSAKVLVFADSTNEFKDQLVESLGSSGKLSFFDISENSAIEEKLAESNFEIAISLNDSLATFYFPPTLKPTALWNVTFPYRPEMETLSKYSVKLNPEKIACLPGLLLNGPMNSPTPEQVTPQLDLFTSSEYSFLERIALAGKSFSSASTKIAVLNYLADQNGPIDDGWFFYNYANLNYLKDRKNYLYKADSLFKQDENLRGSALCRLELARSEESFEKNRKLYEQVLGYSKAHKDSLTQAKTLMTLGELAQKQGQLSAAELYLEESADLHEKGGDLYQAAILLTDLGIVKRKIGKPLDAVHVLEQALLLSERMQSEANIVRVHYELGLTEAAQGHIDKAMHHYFTAADFMEIMGDSIGLATVDNKLGTLYLNQNDLVNAQLRYESALRIYSSINDSSGMLQSHFNLGELTADQGRWDIADEHFLKALQLASKLKNERLVASVLYSKGIARIKQGKYAVGYGDVKEAIDLSDGAVHGTIEESRQFLAKLEALIKEESEIITKKRALQDGL